MDTRATSQQLLAPYSIGLKLRNLRNQKQLTLARLAKETSLSTALLSKLETDRMVPTLPTLATIAGVYGVGLGHFFAEPASHVLSITRQLSTHGRGRSREETFTTPLNSAIPNRRLDLILVDIPPGPLNAPQAPGPGAATALHVLAGPLQLEIGGQRESLHSGDCLYLQSQLPISWRASGKSPARVLVVTEREHASTAP